MLRAGMGFVAGYSVSYGRVEWKCSVSLPLTGPVLYLSVPSIGYFPSPSLRFAPSPSSLCAPRLFVLAAAPDLLIEGGVDRWLPHVSLLGDIHFGRRLIVQVCVERLEGCSSFSSLRWFGVCCYVERLEGR